MKFLISPDSFKGSLDADGVATAIAAGIKRAMPDAETVCLPVADGGEGTLDVLVGENNIYIMEVKRTDGKPCRAGYGIVGNTAVIEMARAAGLCLVPEGERDLEATTTYGVGQLILAALDRGAGSVMLTVGGSGSNDGGAGMLEALGAKFYGKEGPISDIRAGMLGEIVKIDLSGLDKRLFETELTLACDVKNPLVGELGATYVYGPQKNALGNQATLDRLEAGMINYAARLSEASGKDVKDVPGTGAGGGLPAPLVAVFGATIRSGILAVLDALDFDAKLDGVTAVFTGEGKMDEQSAYGKAVGGVAEAAKSRGIPVYALVGIAGEGAEKMKAHGVSGIYATSDIAPSVRYSIEHPGELLEKLAENVIKQNYTI